MFDGDQSRPAPPWLSPTTLAAGLAALRSANAVNRYNAHARVRARDAVLALHPAMPFTMIDEAVVYIFGSA